MESTTCATPECANPAKTRGVCMTCYGRMYRAGEIPPLDRSSQHRISDVDREAKRGVCSLCGPVDIRLRTGGRGPECMVKRRADRAKTRKPTSGYPKSPRAQRRWKYGLSEQDLRAMEEQAAGRCLICDVEFGEEGYSIDHCHDTGLVRGLLCRRCNFGLGWLNDDPSRVLTAYFYLLNGGKTHAA